MDPDELEYGCFKLEDITKRLRQFLITQNQKCEILNFSLPKIKSCSVRNV